MPLTTARQVLVLVSAVACLLVFGPKANCDGLYFPTATTWETVDPADADFDADKLQKVVEYAMSANTSSIVILRDGRIVAEKHVALPNAPRRYQRGVAGTTELGHAIEDVASVQKSVVSFLIGIGVEKGIVEIEQPVSEYLGRGWSQTTADQESAIKVRHLISMTSGLTTQLTYVAPAGDRWAYNTNAYAKSFRALTAAAGMTPNELTNNWLIKRIGMKDSSWRERQWNRGGVDANSIGFATSARDLARFGLLMLARGNWNGERILVDEPYLNASVSPSQQLNPSYGYLWWINGQAFQRRSTGAKVDGPLIPTAPDDLFAAFGALGRKCYVCPSQGLVVTRLGDAPGRPGFDRRLWRLLMAANVREVPEVAAGE